MTRWKGDPDPRHVEAIDAYWVTAAEHGMNASTFTATGDRVDGRRRGGVAVRSGRRDERPAARRRARARAADDRGGRTHRRRAGRGQGHPRPQGQADGLRAPRLPGRGPARPRAAGDGQAPRTRRAYEVAAALEQAALAELRERRPDRAIETNVEFWAAVILDFAGVPAEDDARHVHLRAHRGLVRAHPRAEAARQAGPARGHLRRPGSRAARSPSRAGTRSADVVTDVETFAAAARAFAAWSVRIPETAWDGPGLGEWDLRASSATPRAR